MVTGNRDDFYAALKSKDPRFDPAVLQGEISVYGGGARGECITLYLGYRSPYRWTELLDFFAGRIIPGVEVIHDGKYHRTVHLKTKEQKVVTGWIQVENHARKNVLKLTLSVSLLPLLSQVLSRVRRQFDLDCDPDAVYDRLASMNELQAGLCLPGTRLPGCFDSYEMSVRAVLGQQITVKAASTIAGRMAGVLGRPIQTGIDGLTHAFPTAKDILSLEEPIAAILGPLGVTTTRSKAILALARAFEQKEIDFAPGAKPEVEIKKMIGLPGIGPWTAQYIAMRALNWADAFPATDYGVKKVLGPRSQKEILALAENWRPWRGYATINLWNSLTPQTL